MPYLTDQEAFWAGSFGDDYIERNSDVRRYVASNIALFAAILRKTSTVHSALEVGANIGLNLRALKALVPDISLSAVEINAKAVDVLRRWGKATEIHECSLLTFSPPKRYDFVFTKGVLIHIAPNELARAYDVLYTASGRYIAIVEYYNPTPVTIAYRGHADRLFKRDFAGELLDRFPDLKLVDYGFSYHRDPIFPQDDLSWFVLERSALSGDRADQTSSGATINDCVPDALF